MLALERDRGALGIMLVVAAGRAVGGAGDDRGELPLELSDLTQGLISIGIQPKIRCSRFSHLRHLLFKERIRSAGLEICPARPPIVKGS
jgi:hypothetical protein